MLLLCSNIIVLFDWLVNYYCLLSKTLVIEDKDDCKLQENRVEEGVISRNEPLHVLWKSGL